MAKIIVGLGNPGHNYLKTRHNIGFITIDILLEKYGYESEKEIFKGLVYTTKIKGEKVYFLKPQTFMNLSGESLYMLMNYFKINIEDILIIYDDKDLDFSQIRFKENGSSGGHNGIKNIINHLGTQNFNRLKIGIGKPPENFRIVDWVLSKLSDEELNKIKIKIKNISDFIEEFILNDLKYLQQKYNE